MKKILFLLILVCLGCSKDESEKLFWDRVDGKHFLVLRWDTDTDKEINFSDYDVIGVRRFDRNIGYYRKTWNNARDQQCTSWEPYFTSFEIISETNTETLAQANNDEPQYNIIKDNPLTLYYLGSGSKRSKFLEVSLDDIRQMTNLYNCTYDY